MSKINYRTIYTTESIQLGPTSYPAKKDPISTAHKRIEPKDYDYTKTPTQYITKIDSCDYRVYIDQINNEFFIIKNQKKEKVYPKYSIRYEREK